MTEKTLTTENIKPALDALRGELAPWPVVAKKQDRLNTAQLNAANSGITSSLVAQIIANTAAIRALESAITGTGLRALVVASLPAVGTTGILYIVPVTTYDPETDADVVNYSNEYLWIVAPDAPVTEGYYEQVGQTGIVINNGQLTITVNGTSVGTFTANQSGDTTAAITVPTNADYVDRTTDQTIAGIKTFSSTINGTASKAIADEDGTSIKTGYVNVAGNQTVTGNKTWTGEHTFSEPIIGNLTGTASKAGADADGNTISSTYGKLAGSQTWTGTNSFHNLNPEANSTYTLGTSSYRWSSVYADSYYYGTTAWGLDKANVWTGNNTYTKYQNIIIAGTEIGVAPNNQNRNGLLFQDKNNETLGWMRSAYDPSGDLSIEMLVSNKYSNGALDPNGTQIYQGVKQVITASGESFFSWSGTLSNSVVPRTNNSFDLGTSTSKWKTLNGINPGALSLPSRSYNDSIALDTTNWDYAGNGFIISMTDNNDNYIPGWVVIVAEDVGDVSDFIKIRLTTYTRSPGLDFTTFYTGSQYNIKACFPTAGIGYLLLKLTNGASCIKYARYYPCLGNV